MNPFKIEQLAFSPNGKRGKEFMAALFGVDEWVSDEVICEGKVNGKDSLNKAELDFCYQENKQLEIESLNYTTGENFLGARNDKGVVSHIGTHCYESDLSAVSEFMKKWGCPVVQSVDTRFHTSKFLNETGRRYTYVIYNCTHLIGTHVKFIVRREA